jgi:hypothetical protein
MHTAKDELAEARERFLAAEPVDQGAVRKPILASWWRSRQWHVAADHIELNYLRDPDLESNLARTADPVLRHLHEQLDGQPISIILTDANGLVLTRMTADHDLERALDGIKLAPGFSDGIPRIGCPVERENFAVIHPFSGSPRKNWEGMAAIAEAWRASGGTVVALQQELWPS